MSLIQTDGDHRGEGENVIALITGSEDLNYSYSSFSRRSKYHSIQFNLYRLTFSQLKDQSTDIIK